MSSSRNDLPINVVLMEWTYEMRKNVRGTIRQEVFHTRSKIDRLSISRGKPNVSCQDRCHFKEWMRTCQLIPGIDSSYSFPYISAFVLLIAGFQQCEAADYCYFNNKLSYCNYGCCSNSCCGMSTLAIIGLVIGAILSLAAVVGCIICLACMCKQSKANRDCNMVQPMPNNNTNTVYVHNAPNAPYHPPPRAPPPSYGQYGSYPGSSDTNYGFNDAAYPPGSHPPPAYSYSNPKSDKY